MYSNRYIAFHCCQEKYLDEIKKDGISKETKAVFILDLKNINKKEIYNTLAVLAYHGIGISGWKSMLTNNQKLNEIDKSLIIFIAKVSDKQEAIINKNSDCNYYNIIANGERTLNYWKIKEIGAIKSIIEIKKQKLYKSSIKKDKKIDPAKDRFFVKNTYSEFNINSKEESVKEIEKICYKIAAEQIDSVIEEVLKINNNREMVLI